MSICSLRKYAVNVQFAKNINKINKCVFNFKKQQNTLNESVQSVVNIF